MPATSNAYGTFKGHSTENPENRQPVSNSLGKAEMPHSSIRRLSEMIPREGQREICIVIKTSSLFWGIIKLLELLVLMTCLACLGTFVGQFSHEEQMNLLGNMDLIFTLLAGLIVFTLVMVYLTFSGVSNLFGLKRWLCMMMVGHLMALFFCFMISVFLSRDSSFYHSSAHSNNTQETLCSKVSRNTAGGITCSYVDAVLALSWIGCFLLFFDVLSYFIAFHHTSPGESTNGQSTNHHH